MAVWNQYSISATIVRLFSVGLMIYALHNSSFAFLLLTSESGTTDGQFFMLIAAVFAPSLIAVLLWTKPNLVVEDQNSSNHSDEKIGQHGLMLLRNGTSLIGLYLTITSTAYILQWFMTYIPMDSFRDDQIQNPSAIYAPLVPEVLIAIAGIILIIGAASISRVLFNIKNYGVD